jgi:hypothetical protein
VSACTGTVMRGVTSFASCEILRTVQNSNRILPMSSLFSSVSCLQGGHVNPTCQNSPHAAHKKTSLTTSAASIAVSSLPTETNHIKQEPTHLGDTTGVLGSPATNLYWGKSYAANQNAKNEQQSPPARKKADSRFVAHLYIHKCPRLRRPCPWATRPKRTTA